MADHKLPHPVGPEQHPPHVHLRLLGNSLTTTIAAINMRAIHNPGMVGELLDQAPEQLQAYIALARRIQQTGLDDADPNGGPTA